jgi:hypothetical protein
MHYVILRDDDTNALTPVAWLDRLYRPFLDRGLPVNLAVIPGVRTDVTMEDGRPEGFLVAKNGEGRPTVSIGENQELIRYLRENPGYHFAQHGFDHERDEFDRTDRREIRRRLESGRTLLNEAGLESPRTFVAPYDKISADSLSEIADQFPVVSTGWFELRRLPLPWWPRYALKKTRGAIHWRVNQTTLLSHPGCLLSYHRPYTTMADRIRNMIESRRLTVLVTHWWEYFRHVRPDEPFIEILHETASYLASQKDIQVISFDDLVDSAIPLN